MEQIQTQQTKTPFYKKKFIMVPLVAIMLVAIVSAAAFTYYHSTQATLVVDEARSSADLPITLTGYSGETVCNNVSITNAGQNQLNSLLNYTINSNPNGVTFTSNLDGGIIVATDGKSTQEYPACFTFNTDTINGTVDLTIYYSKEA